MAAINCATDALMLGSLMMFASGCKVSLPKSAKVLGTRCSGLRKSENSPKMRLATEISLVSTFTPAGWVKVRMMGKKEAVASNGASSVRV